MSLSLSFSGDSIEKKVVPPNYFKNADLPPLAEIPERNPAWYTWKGVRLECPRYKQVRYCDVKLGALGIQKTRR